MSGGTVIYTELRARVEQKKCGAGKRAKEQRDKGTEALRKSTEATEGNCKFAVL
jgi:hypothetical protein